MSKDATENKLWADAGPQLRRDIFQHAYRLYCGDTEPKSVVSHFRHSRKYRHQSGSWAVVYTDKPDTELCLAEGFQLVSAERETVGICYTPIISDEYNQYIENSARLAEQYQQQNYFMHQYYGSSANEAIFVSGQAIHINNRL